MTSSPPKKVDLTGLSVLIVEDEFYLAMEMQDEIERAGGKVIGPTADGAHALTVVARGGIDCAVVDINLGEGPSYELADALRSAGTPFVFMTGYDPAAIPDRFQSVERLLKPASITELLRVVERTRAG